MKNKFIIHVPHSSLKFPKIFWNYITLDKNYINTENIFMSDYMIDNFLPDETNFNIIKFNYSRLFCDVERFKNDEKEEMSKLGMGVVYNIDSNGVDFINYTVNYKNSIIKNYYDLHHKKLDDIASKIVNKYGICYIIDLHSFSDEFVYKVFNYKDCPDICIGIDRKYLDENILKTLEDVFSKYEYSVMINYPYKGTLVPNKFIDDSHVKSIMIEINKRIYLDNNITLNLKKAKKLKKCMNEFYNLIGNFYDKYN